MSRRPGAWLLLALALPRAAAGEPALDSAIVEARVADDLSVSVEARYFLEPAGASEVELTSIVLFGARVANVRAFVDGREASFLVEERSTGRLDGTVRLPGDNGRTLLRLTYEVLVPDNAQPPSEVTVPLLVVRWPPAEARPETVAATVSLPAGWSAHSAFPSDFERVDPVDLTSDARVYRVALPVMPSLLRLRIAAGEPPLMTMERAADLAAAAALLMAALLGWRRLREGIR